MKKDLMCKYLYLAHAHSGCFVNEKSPYVQILIFCPFLPMPILVVLSIFDGQLPEWAQMGLSLPIFLEFINMIASAKFLIALT